MSHSQGAISDRIHPNRLYSAKEVAPMVGYVNDYRSFLYAIQNGTTDVPMMKQKNGRLVIRGRKLESYLERKG